MSEHEQLKEICDKIWTSLFTKRGQWSDKEQAFIIWWSNEIADVREIIFTPEFMDKFMTKVYWRNNIMQDEEVDFCCILIDDHLDKPVQYLYKTLWL